MDWRERVGKTEAKLTQQLGGLGNKDNPSPVTLRIIRFEYYTIGKEAEATEATYIILVTLKGTIFHLSHAQV